MASGLPESHMACLRSVPRPDGPTRGKVYGVVDGYAAAAQYYDLLHGERSAAQVRALLTAAHAEIRTGIVDLGAGTGAVLAEAAREAPDVPIVAVEPSLGMRTALLTRLAADPALRARTTVLPETDERLDLTGVADLALCLDTSPAFPPPYRPDIWARVHAALVPGGLFLLDEPHLTEPVAQETIELARTEIGTLTVIGTVRGEPAGQRQWWEYRYTLLDAEGEVVADDATEFYTWPVGTEELRAELTDAGFVVKDDIELEHSTVLVARK
jgi:SAM-dependent methyltransferase